mmetsp:Transcript_6046/g.25304  ORF Transcript_6046/g.25304 Transcript_6046/m.25304 type:complete len:248 (-) Transcript_6046:12-755(-)
MLSHVAFMTAGCAVRNSMTSSPYHPVCIVTKSRRGSMRYTETLRPPDCSSAVYCPAISVSASSVHGAPDACVLASVAKIIAMPVFACWCANLLLTWSGSMFCSWLKSMPAPPAAARRFSTMASYTSCSDLRRERSRRRAGLMMSRTFRARQGFRVPSDRSIDRRCLFLVHFDDDSAISSRAETTGLGPRHELLLVVAVFPVAGERRFVQLGPVLGRLGLGVRADGTEREERDDAGRPSSLVGTHRCG